MSTPTPADVRWIRRPIPATAEEISDEICELQADTATITTDLRTETHARRVASLRRHRDTVIPARLDRLVRELASIRQETVA